MVTKTGRTDFISPGKFLSSGFATMHQKCFHVILSFHTILHTDILLVQEYKKLPSVLMTVPIKAASFINT